MGLISSLFEKECFNNLIRGIVDTTSGKFDKQENDLKSIAVFSDRAAYAYCCYITDRNFVDLFLKNFYVSKMLHINGRYPFY
jgi:hypothetical protein